MFLDPDFTAILEREPKAVLHLIARATGEADSTRRCQLLQPRRNIHTVAVEVVSLHHHVAEVYADPKFNPRLGRQIRICLINELLNFQGTAYGFHHACELCQKAIANFLEDPALMRRYARFDNVC